MARNVPRLLNDTGGAVAGTVALSLFALVAVGGIAFDYARMATLDSELQNAADQAALAAASQLDGENGACARAVAAARNVVINNTLMANDIGTAGLAVTIANSTVCNVDGVQIADDATASIRFFQDKAATTAATNAGNANFVQVLVNTRRADFALTPIVAAFNSGNLGASARAGMGTALCKVPPLMICPPAGTIDWSTMRGKGIRAVSNSGPNWAPGNFGYIGPSDANSTQVGLAFQNPVFQCQQIEGSTAVSSGAPTGAITAINSRFDIYDMSSGSGTALAPCHGTACPPALNTTKDLVRQSGAGRCGLGGHANNINNEGWHLPDANRRFEPEAAAGTDPMRSFQKSGQPIDAMGLPRDNCHYTSYGSSCGGTNSRFGDGVWARGDYFTKYHASRIATYGTQMATMTRYETYRWEITNNFIPSEVAVLATGDRQDGRPVCNATIPDSTRDRRVLQVVVGKNCGSLNGNSVPVQFDTWIEVFLVEPGVPNPGRGNGDSGNEIYLEVIGEVDPGGAAPQVIRRDVPYLVR